MSSGIEWKYQISNRNPEEPPISYSIGVGWGTGHLNDLTVGLVSGLGAVRTAYSDLPGLGYHRQLWLNARMSGPAQIADTASKHLLDIFARKQGKKSPLIHGGFNIEDRKVGEWFQDNGFLCGREIAEYAGVALDAPFLTNWELLAIAAEEWPRQRWGICPKVTAIRVVATTYRGDQEVGKDEALRVLDAAESWARAIDQRSIREKADAGLVHLLDKEVVTAAVAVTRKEGSVAGLRHALRVSGYIK